MILLVAELFQALILLSFIIFEREHVHMNQLELDKMLDRHEQWLKDERKEHPEWRADFKDMQLSGNDFRQSVLELA